LQYPQLLASQEAIGWDHLVRGRFSLLWSELQQDYTYRVYPKTKFDPAKWQRRIINPMPVDCHNLWFLRNDERHRKEASLKRNRKMEQLERNLIAIYKFEPEVLAADRDISRNGLHPASPSFCTADEPPANAVPSPYASSQLTFIPSVNTPLSQPAANGTTFLTQGNPPPWSPMNTMIVLIPLSPNTSPECLQPALRLFFHAPITPHSHPRRQLTFSSHCGRDSFLT
jgi:hypothetical protein